MKATYLSHPAINMNSRRPLNAMGGGNYDLENGDALALGSNQQFESSQGREADTRLMAESDVAFDGRSYWYRQYRYDLLEDALAYARLDTSRPVHPAETEGQRHWQQPDEPSAATKGLMAELGIVCDGKYYRYDDYRYDRFFDAINYAQLIKNRPDK